MIILGAAKNPNVEALQRALNALAISTGNQAFKVTVDGFMGPLTMTAALSAVGIVGSYITNSAIRIVLIGLPVYAAIDPTGVQNKVTEYAGEFSKAILAYIAAKAALPQTPPSAPPTTSATYPKVPIRVLDPRLFQQPSTPTPPTPGSTTISSIHAFDPKLNAYRVAKLIGTAGWGSFIPTHIEVGMAPSSPSNSQEVSLPSYWTMIGRRSWYQTWWGLAAIGVGVLGAGYGAFALTRKAT